MRVVLQRVSRASVTVRGEVVASIGPGFLLLVGVGADDEGKMNRSLWDVEGKILVVPQFTLYGDWRRGRRPSWIGAAAPEIAAERVEAFCAALESLGATVARGAFREHMEVELVNDGPVTLVFDATQLEGGG